MISNIYPTILLAILLFAACIPASKDAVQSSAEELAQTLKADKSAITALIKAYEEAIEKQDPVACTSVFAEDGVLHADGTQALSGQELLDWYNTIIDPNVETNIDLNIEELQVHHDWAYVRTHNPVTKTQNNESTNLETKSFVLFQRQADGTWKIKLYAFDSIENDES